MRSTRASKSDGEQNAGASNQIKQSAGCKPISLLVDLEEENRDLRKSVADLALENHLLKTGQGRSTKE
jgi:hypothetical protein